MWSSTMFFPAISKEKHPKSTLKKSLRPAHFKTTQRHFALAVTSDVLFLTVYISGKAKSAYML